MPEFQVGKILTAYDMIVSLTQMLTITGSYGRTAGMPWKNINLFRQHTKIAAEECMKMGLTVSAAAASDLAEWLGKLLAGANENESVPIMGEIGARIENYARQVQTILQREAEGRKFFIVAAEHQRFYEPRGFLFTPEVDVNFGSIRYDLTEAGKCLALERSTAAVYHLVRCLEAGIRAIARCLGIPDPTTGYGRNWGHILKDVKAAIDKRWPHNADRQGGDGQTFESLYGSLAAIKSPYRDSTMHLEEKYTEEEGRYVFEMVKGLMTKIAARMDENGDPKV